MPRDMIARKDVDEAAMTVTFRWFEGRDAEGKPQWSANGTTINVDAYPDAIRNRLALHGAAQKLGDAYAGAGGDVDAAKAAVEEMHSRLANGEWTERREVAEKVPGGREVANLVEALKRLREKAGEPFDPTGKAAQLKKDKGMREYLLSLPKVVKELRAIEDEQRRARASQIPDDVAARAAAEFGL